MRKQENIRLSDAVDRYLRRIERLGHAETSVRTASYALEQFQQVLWRPKNPDPLLHTLTVKDIEEACFGPKGLRDGVKAITFNRRRSVLIQFFRYANMMTWVDDNPMRTIEPSRRDSPTAKLLLSPAEMIALLEHASNPVERVALSVGMNTGLRANDLKRLTIFDVNLGDGTIQTEIRKTKKLDVKPITMDLERELIRWLDLYTRALHLSSRSEIPNNYLLIPVVQKWRLDGIAVNVQPLTTHSHPWRMVQRPLKRMGYETKQNGFHVLRRSSARALFEMLRDNDHSRDHALMIVKEYLNHSSTAQTEHYLGLNHERTLRDDLLKGQPFITRKIGVVSEEDSDRVRPLREVAG